MRFEYINHGDGIYDVDASHLQRGFNIAERKPTVTLSFHSAAPRAILPVEKRLVHLTMKLKQTDPLFGFDGRLKAGGTEQLHGHLW